MLQSVRILLLTVIVGIIHLQHEQYLRRAHQSAETSPSLSSIRTAFPLADRLETATNGSLRVFDRDGMLLGYALQTSPHSDEIVGFSGPTNVLIGLDSQQRVVHVSILSSGDTPEHVAKVKSDPRFLNRFLSKDKAEITGARRVDGVSGATLTSLAVAESIRRRLGGTEIDAASLKFPDPLELTRVKELFPDAASVRRLAPRSSLWQVQDVAGKELGRILRTSPAADNIVGYQGPTDTLIALDGDRRVTRIWVNRSYENEPYYGYLNEDWSFPSLFEGFTLEELAELDLQAAGIEGVSGATMTSQAVVRGVVAAAQQYQQEQRRPERTSSPSRPFVLGGRDWGTAAAVLAGVVIGLTHLRGRKWVRIPYQLVVIGYLGITNGDLLSQAMFVGWTQSGVPWQTSAGLCLLTIAAVAVPVTSGRNVYCSHICPHGAAQQLLKRRLTWQWHPPRAVRRLLEFIPGLLLVWCLLVALFHWPFSLVGVEPFNAYVLSVAGWATISVALIGLVASLFIPMAYCRYGCPTGALLNFVRRRGGGDQWRRGDSLAVACVVGAIAVYLAT